MKVTLTEEVARWAFEICLEGSDSDWFVAFSNPTAGPWKTISGLDRDGTLTSIHRFGQTDERPDLVAVSDTHSAIVVVEAKGKLADLDTTDQIAKSARVVREMAQVFSALNSDEAWERRAGYRVIGALLWGVSGKADTSAEHRVLTAFRDELGSLSGVDSRVVLGIVSTQDGSGTVACTGYAWPNAVAADAALLTSMGLS